MTARRKARCQCRELPGAACRENKTVENVPWESVKPATENEALYSHWDIRSADDKGLYESIRERGILEPIVVDADGVILSGHRRHQAALSAGFAHVPIRRESVRLADLEPGERLRVLAAYNSQRAKSPEEQAREALVTVEPGDAWRHVRQRIAERERQAYTRPVNAMTIRGAMHRSKISDAKKPMLEAVRSVIEARRSFWPCSVRAIHYGLLNSPPLVHAGKRRSRYRNDRESYRALVDLCARGRLAGLIPWEAVSDETRPVELWRTHATAGEYVADEARYMLGCYRRDLTQGQTRHVEVIVEKNTSAELVRRVADDYTLPVTSGRGFCSLEPRRQIAERFAASGKRGLVLVFVSDADPDGDEIAESFVRSLRDDFTIIETEGVRAALTPKQAAADGLPPNTDAKTTSPNFKKYVARHGTKAVYELEAIPPKRLQDLVRQAVESVLDMAVFERQVEQWRHEADGLEAVRRRVVAAALRNKIRT